MPNTELQIRPARAEDHPLLVELWERSARATHHFLTESDIVTLRPQVADELASQAIAWYVATTDTDVPIGFLGYAPGAIEGLFIDPDHIGHGAGTRLIAYAQELAGGPLSVEVNEQNEAAQRFYTAVGFSVVSRSAHDAAGRPFPLLRMQRPAQR
jgi:putative acetyltransferase